MMSDLELQLMIVRKLRESSDLVRDTFTINQIPTCSEKTVKRGINISKP